jgi:hypothetical protein
MKGRSYSGPDDQAVSETIGYIIIFGIMLTGIALVTLYGYPMLVQEQQNTNIRNMERNMIVLQNDLKGLTYKNVPYKETTLQVAGGTMVVFSEPGMNGGLKSNFTVDVYANGSEVLSFDTGEISYTSQDTTTRISLENGAVHTRYWSFPLGSAMLAEPRWFYDNETKTFVMSFITLNATEYFAQTGIGTVGLKLTDTDQNTYDLSAVAQKPVVHYYADPENNYNIAWRNYFNKSSLRMNYISGGGFDSSFSLDPGLQTLVIKTYNVTVISL